MNEEIKERFILSNELNIKIQRAVNKLTTLVGMTMGPLGQTVIIPDPTEHGKYKITKDGVSVAKTVKSKDPFESVVINLMREVAKETVNIAGDGTTTSIVLTGAFIENFKRIGMNSHMRTIFDQALEDTIAHLDSKATKLTDTEIKQVALISSNGDEVIAENINKAYTSSKNVLLRTTTKDTDSVESFEGMYIPTTSLISFPREIKNIEKPKILVINTKIQEFSLIKNTIQYVASSNQPLVIIADHLNENIIRNIESIKRTNNLEIYVHKSPGYSSQRTKLLNDICVYTGGKVVTQHEKGITIDMLGEVDSIEIHIDKLVLQSTANKSKVNDLISSLGVELEIAETEHEKDLINQRLERLSNLSIIHVGAHSEVDLAERYDRYEDAIKAVSCAISEGVIEGGGLELAKYAKSKLIELNYDPEERNNIMCSFYLALLRPLEIIMSSGVNINVDSEVKGLGVLDPVKVTKTALQKSYNFAKVLVTTNALILTQDEREFN